MSLLEGLNVALDLGRETDLDSVAVYVEVSKSRVS